MEYRWLTYDEVESEVNPILALRGMAILNIDEANPICRVMGAWEDGHLVEFLTIQLVPMLGPMVRVDNTKRDGGEVSRELVDRLYNYLEDAGARTYLVVADNPFTARLCERHQMDKVNSPVYSAAGRKLECNHYTSGQVN